MFKEGDGEFKNREGANTIGLDYNVLLLRDAEIRSRLISFVVDSLFLFKMAFILYTAIMGFVISLLVGYSYGSVIIISSALSISLSAVLLGFALQMAVEMELKKKYLTYPTRCLDLCEELNGFFAGSDPYSEDVEFNFKLLNERLAILRLKYRKEDYPEREYESATTNPPIEEVSVVIE